MRPTTKKISLLLLSTLLLYLSCSDNNIMNIYNKYTEGYRKAPDDLLITADTCITVRVLSSHTDKPLANTYVVITRPANDTLSGVTSSEGIALFYTGKLSEGTYSIKAVLIVNGTEFSRKNTYYLYEKNNPALTIYMDENSWYK